MKERGTKRRLSDLVFWMLPIIALAVGCSFTPPDIPETTTAMLDLQQFNRREELAVLKAQPSNTVSVDALQNIANSFLKTKNDGRSAEGGRTALITNVNKLPSLTDKRFIRTVNNGRSLENVEEEPVELYCFTVENPDAENDGFILTSNDDRIGYILAVVDNGDLTDTENPFTEFFTARLADYIEETIAVYSDITGEETQAALEKWQSIDPEARTLTAHWGVVGDNYVATGGYDSDFTSFHKDNLIKTKWGYDAPYNAYVDYYQDRNNKLGSKNYVAGCGPVAVAQLIAYWEYISNTNKPISFNNVPAEPENLNNPARAGWNGTYNFTNLTAQAAISKTGTGAAETALRGQVAALMHHAGLSINAEYLGDYNTIAWTDKIASGFRDIMGYTSSYSDFIDGTVLTDSYSSFSITYKNNSKDWVISQLTAKPKARPILVRGDKITIDSSTQKKEIGGHFWLIDNYGTITYYTEYLNRKDDTKSVKTVYTSTWTFSNCIMVHCNLGWDGWNNGWYLYGIFDTSHMAALGENDYRDSAKNGDYSNNIHMFAPYR